MSRTRAPKFTIEQRARFLAFLETGHSLDEACAKVDISRQTVHRWASDGREEEGTDRAEFARRYDEIRGLSDTEMSQEDLIRVLEVQARKGNVQAARLLLEKPWEKAKVKDDQAAPEPAPDLRDELAARRRAHG